MTYGRPRILSYTGDVNRVTIGAYTSIADNVTIFVGGNHRTDWVTTFALRAKLNISGAYVDGHPSSNGDVKIGNDVWVGWGGVLLSYLELALETVL